MSISQLLFVWFLSTYWWWLWVLLNSLLNMKAVVAQDNTCVKLLTNAFNEIEDTNTSIPPVLDFYLHNFNECNTKTLYHCLHPNDIKSMYKLWKNILYIR